VIADYSKEHTRPFWQTLSEAYAKQTGVKVDLQVLDWNSIDQQVTTMIQNNQPPDVLNLNSFASYAKDGLLYPAEEILSSQTREDFLPAFVRGGEYQGTLYGFPILSSARAFFYNEELLTRAGIAEPPRTWDEFVRAAQRIRALGKDTIGYALPLGPEEAQAEWSIWMWNNGGDWKSGDRWTINSDKNLQTLQFLADLAHKHKVTQVNPGKTNRTDGAFQLFKDGKVGMVIGVQPVGQAARCRGQGQVRRRGDADERRHLRDPCRRGLPDGLQEAGRRGGGQEVPRALLPARDHHAMDPRGGFPPGDQVRSRTDAGRCGA
jgi:multiple sugar transport system substrate-binding protein